MDCRTGGTKALSTWGSVPEDLLAKCLRNLDRESRCIAFQTCSAFAKAIFSTAHKPCVSISNHHVAHPDSVHGLLCVLRWLLPTGVHDLKFRVHACESAPIRFSVLKDKLQVVLSAVTTADFTCVILDGGLYSSPYTDVSAVFPNLKQLWLTACTIDAPPSTLPHVGCSLLTALHLLGDTEDQQAWSKHLLHLQALPSLCSLHLQLPASLTTCLPSTVSQLTHLQLSGFQDQAVVTQVAQQCTNLQSLRLWTMPSILLAKLTTMTQLRELVFVDQQLLHSMMNHYSLSSLSKTPDLNIGTLLGFPHLEQLTCQELGQPQLIAAHRHCPWKRLCLGAATPRLLACLPLHSLTEPLQLGCLMLDDPDLRLADVFAAVRNFEFMVNVPAPRVASWAAAGHVHIALHARQHDVDVLHAAAPLIPHDASAITIHYGTLHARLILALQRVLPPTTTSLTLHDVQLDDDSSWVALGKCCSPTLLLLKVDVNAHLTLLNIIGFYLAPVLDTAIAQDDEGGFPWTQVVGPSLVLVVGRDKYAWGKAFVQELKVQLPRYRIKAEVSVEMEAGEEESGELAVEWEEMQAGVDGEGGSEFDVSSVEGDEGLDDWDDVDGVDEVDDWDYEDEEGEEEEEVEDEPDEVEKEECGSKADGERGDIGKGGAGEETGGERADGADLRSLWAIVTQLTV